jgi:hypothetical protein
MKTAVTKLFKYQRRKQSSINSLKNGRVDISGKYEKNSKIPLFAEENNGIKEYNVDYLSHIYEGTPVQYLFFSKVNIAHLQKLMKYHVYLQSGKKHIIGNQDHNQLIIIMKSVYLQNGQNSPINLKQQVKRLNAFVLEYAIPNILLNIEQHKVYKKNVSTLPKPMELPKYISSAGTRTNPNIIY